MLHNELVTWCSIERQLSLLQLCSNSSSSINGRTVADDDDDDDGVGCPVQSVDWSVYRIQFSFYHQLFTVNSQAIDEGSPSLCLSLSLFIRVQLPLCYGYGQLNGRTNNFSISIREICSHSFLACCIHCQLHCCYCCCCRCCWCLSCLHDLS